MSGPRVSNHLGEWFPVTESTPDSLSAADQPRPVPPVLEGGDGSIFIAIPSYRDGERCGATLKSLFENAEHPEKIFVGLVEQNNPQDKFCLEVYCKFYGIPSIKRNSIRADVTKIMTLDTRDKCPHFDQVRLVATHDIGAKGPLVARSLARKALGDEEFCMQVDAHTEFTDRWDTAVREEWIKTRNEFGIISNVPASAADKEDYMTGTKRGQVPRQCQIVFRDNGFPDYRSPPDAAVSDLTVPLLASTWSAAFSFAKCHLEETAPYDAFAPYAMPVEQFSRFARFWTRGYDVYTPSRNIVYHDYGPQENGHGNAEWYKHRRDRFRKMSLERVQTLVKASSSGATTAEGKEAVAAHANMGIYGLGKRRTMEQLQEFCHIKLKGNKGNVGPKTICDGYSWVPYDASISPAANLFNQPVNLDPQPEFPMRTKLVYYEQQQQQQSSQQQKDSTTLLLDNEGDARELQQQHKDAFVTTTTTTRPALPSASLLTVLWIFGLVVWCAMFLNPTAGGGGWAKMMLGSGKKRGGAAAAPQPRKKKSVKDV